MRRVRPVPPYVDAEGAVVRLADDRERGPAAATPAGRDRHRGRRLQLQGIEQPRRSGEHGHGVGVADVANRRYRPGQPGAPVRLHGVGPDLGQRLGLGLLHAHPARPHDHHGLAFGGQQLLLAVQADRVDPDPGPLLQQLDSPGQRPQLARSVEDHHDVWPKPGLLTSGISGRLLPLAHNGEQFGDPGSDRLRVVADQHGAVLPGLRAAVRQPAGPVPARLSRGVGEHVQPQVVRAVQGGSLRYKPTSRRTRDISGASHTNHAPSWQRDRDRCLRDAPDHLAPVLVLLGISQLHIRGQVGSPGPKHQVIGIGTTPLPQPAPRASSNGQHRGRVRKLVDPLSALSFQGYPGIVLNPDLVFPVSCGPAPSGLPALPTLAQLAANQHDRTQASNGQQVHLMQEIRHGHAQDQRHGGHEDRQRAAFRLWRRSRKLEPGATLRRQQPRRPVEVDT